MQQFSSALESGQLGPIVSQLSVNPDAVSAASQGNMAGFIKALEKSTEGGTATSGTTKDDKKEENPKDDKKPKDDDDEGMQLD